MRYCKVPPGDSPQGDAFNLLVAACQGGDAGKRMAETVADYVKDWSQVSAFMAGYFSIVVNKIDESNPQFMETLADMIDQRHGVTQPV